MPDLIIAYEWAYMCVCVLWGWLGRLAEAYYSEVDAERYMGDLEETICAMVLKWEGAWYF